MTFDIGVVTGQAQALDQLIDDVLRHALDVAVPLAECLKKRPLVLEDRVRFILAYVR